MVHDCDKYVKQACKINCRPVFDFQQRPSNIEIPKIVIHHYSRTTHSRHKSQFFYLVYSKHLRAEFKEAFELYLRVSICRMASRYSPTFPKENAYFKCCCYYFIPDLTIKIIIRNMKTDIFIQKIPGSKHPSSAAFKYPI